MQETTFTYKEWVPDEPLKRLIQCYWALERKSSFIPAQRYIFADGLSEIFVNLGTTIPYINQTPLKPGRLYFGGTMTTTGTITGLPNSVFAGIRFRPGGIAAFYQLNAAECVDEIIDLPDPELYSLLYPDEQMAGRLDHFFLRKLNTRILSFLPISETVDIHQGQITVDELARQHHISRRSLERHFNATIGIGPKEFIKVIRFHHLLQKLQTKEPQESLLRIAYEMGYYDHAHLTREVKKYGGQNPSELIRAPKD